MTRPGANGWSSPQIIVAILSLLMAAGGSYLALQRDDSREVAREMNDHARRLAILETKQDILWRERERHERDRGGE